MAVRATTAGSRANQSADDCFTRRRRSFPFRRVRTSQTAAFAEFRKLITVRVRGLLETEPVTRGGNPTAPLDGKRRISCIEIIISRCIMRVD